jgi:hypothetical protein
MENTHHEPNYMNIFWALTVLTIMEVAAVYLPLSKFEILSEVHIVACKWGQAQTPKE